jgi:hypothetical protein
MFQPFNKNGSEFETTYLSKVVIGLPQDAMKKVNSAKGASDQGEDTMSSDINLCLRATVREDVTIAKFAERELAVIGMSSKIFHAMKTLA